jgi:hypothetical protein
LNHIQLCAFWGMTTNCSCMQFNDIKSTPLYWSFASSLLIQAAKWSQIFFISLTAKIP